MSKLASNGVWLQCRPIRHSQKGPQIGVKKLTTVLTSGVTTDLADPAMRGARGLMGAQNYGSNFFTVNLTQQFFADVH